MSHGSDKRGRALAVNAAKMRRDGCTLGYIAERLGIPREYVANRVTLGERLLQLEDPIRAHERTKL